jgi:hypothetical protein
LKKLALNLRRFEALATPLLAKSFASFLIQSAVTQGMLKTKYCISPLIMSE